VEKHWECHHCSLSVRNYKAIEQHFTAHSLWRNFTREFQCTRAKPATLSDEGQDFINNWPCSDVTTTSQKLLQFPNVRNSFLKSTNHDITCLIYRLCIVGKNQKS